MISSVKDFFLYALAGTYLMSLERFPLGMVSSSKGANVGGVAQPKARKAARR